MRLCAACISRGFQYPSVWEVPRAQLLSFQLSALSDIDIEGLLTDLCQDFCVCGSVTLGCVLDPARSAGNI